MPEATRTNTSTVRTQPQHDDLRQLALVTLTPKNKHDLFHGAINASKSSMEKTQALLARMQHLDPSAAREFGLKKVAVSRAPFRLLRTLTTWDNAILGLKRTLGIYESGKGMSFLTGSNSTSDGLFKSFIALSYCWHKDDWTPAPECQRVGESPISSTMLRALLDQRKSPDEGVWIDACCIDQENKTEKMQAIGSMDVIFKSARLVVIVLEDICLSQDEADFLRSLQARDREPGITDKRLPGMREDLLRILSCRWFTRAWCSHEFLLGPNSLFLVPAKTGVVQLTIFTLGNLLSMCDYNLPELQEDDPLIDIYTRIPFRAFTTLHKAGVLRQVSEYYPSTPMAQFSGIFGLEATYDTDKIGIGINVAGLQLYFAGPKKSVHECRWILALLALSAGDLSALCGTGPPISLSTDERTSSWLRWNDDPEDSIASWNPPTFQGFSHITSIDPSSIVLDLFGMQHCTLHTPSTDSIRRATTFIDDYFKMRRDLMNEDEDPSIPQYLQDRLQVHRRESAEVVACCLDCGLFWMQENITFSPDVGSEAQLGINRLKFDLWPLIADLLIDTYPDKESTITQFTNEQKQSILLFIYYMAFDFRRPQSKSLYDSGVRQGSSPAQYRWLDFGGLVGKALTNTMSDKVPECHFALPVVLSGRTCATMARLWLLRPWDSSVDNEWRIIEKITFVTFRPIQEDGENIILRRNQTIRG